MDQLFSFHPLGASCLPCFARGLRLSIVPPNHKSWIHPERIHHLTILVTRIHTLVYLYLQYLNSVGSMTGRVFS